MLFQLWQFTINLCSQRFTIPHRSFLFVPFAMTTHGTPANEKIVTKMRTTLKVKKNGEIPIDIDVVDNTTPLVTYTTSHIF